MIPELGHFALVLALLLSVAQVFFGLAGAARAREAWMAAARSAVVGQFVFVAISFAVLTHAFVARDFSVLYVASNSNSELPLFFRIAAVWGAHEGSLLLWSLCLGGWSLAVTAASGSLDAPFRSRVIGFLGVISVGFQLFMLTTSNPFARLMPAAAEGADLNPLLQDFALTVHPPILYLGYVGFSVAFAFACATPHEGGLQAAARLAAGGRTTSWAGAGGGSGTRSRTRLSCPGLRGLRSSTRSRSPRSAGCSRAGRSCSRSRHSPCRCSVPSSSGRAC